MINMAKARINNKELEDKILWALRTCPGMRKRTIAWDIHKPTMEVIAMVDQMETEDKIFKKTHVDPANCQRYDKWYVVENPEI